jgi:hypothetical protein
MAKPVSGGGIRSKVTSQKLESTRVKPTTRAVSPSAADQLGQNMGNLKGGKPNPAEKLYQGRSFQPVPMGNQLATNIGKGGPGTGRVTMHSGSQGTHGPVVGERAGPARGIDERGRVK